MKPDVSQPAFAIGATLIVLMLAFDSLRCVPDRGPYVGASPAGFTQSPRNDLCWKVVDAYGNGYAGMGIPPAEIRARGWEETRVGPCAVDAGWPREGGAP